MSLDPPEVSERFRRKLGAHFTFLSDQEGKLLDRLNLRHEAGFRADVAFPTGVLVDRYGIVRWVYEAEFGHMRMTPQDLFDAMERLTLEEQNRELQRGRAVSKVVRQVFLMRKPRDLADAIGVMQEELRALGLEFSICGIAIVASAGDRVTAFTAAPAGEPGEREVDLTRAELGLDEVPEVGKLIDSWRTREVGILRFDSGCCPERLSRLASRREEQREPSAGEGVPPPAGPGSRGDLLWLVNVPFSHGTVFVGGNSQELPSDDDVRTLTEFADAISVAYQRFVDFRELELRNRELQETQLQLVQSEKMASLGQLVAGVAHELNTPIGAIHSNTQSAAGALERLRKRVAVMDALDESDHAELLTSFQALGEMTRVNETASQRIIQIVSNLRRFARLDESEWKRVDLREGLEETLALVQHETRGRIEIRRAYEEIPAVGCYAGQLNQVFMNLIVNAVQAIDGSGEIRIETRAEADHVVVRISDTGRGIASEHLDKVFDPGFTTKGVGVGTGLGLAICYQIVRNHGGRLDVSSEAGKGSTFTVALPLNARPPSPSSTARPVLAPALSKT